MHSNFQQPNWWIWYIGKKKPLHLLLPPWNQMYLILNTIMVWSATKSRERDMVLTASSSSFLPPSYSLKPPQIAIMFKDIFLFINSFQHKQKSRPSFYGSCCIVSKDSSDLFMVFELQQYILGICILSLNFCGRLSHPHAGTHPPITHGRLI